MGLCRPPGRSAGRKDKLPFPHGRYSQLCHLGAREGGRGANSSFPSLRDRSSRRHPWGRPSPDEMIPFPSPPAVDGSLEPIDQGSSFESRSLAGDWSKSDPGSPCPSAGVELNARQPTPGPRSISFVRRSGGARGGRERHARIRLATLGSVMAATSRIRPPQAGQRSASTSKTRFSKSDHAARRRSDSLRSVRESDRGGTPSDSPSPEAAPVELTPASQDAAASNASGPAGTTWSRALEQGASTP